MKTLLKSVAIVCTLLLAKPQAAEKTPSIGIVNFATCIQESKFGKQEQSSLESLKNQLQKSIEDIHNQLNDAVTKLQDSDYLDSLNPDAEKELKMKFQTLNEELNRYQGQYYQIMQQANMKLIQIMNDLINQASEQVAKKEKLSLVLNKEIAFHFAEAMDITKKVVEELDKKYDDQKKVAQVTESKNMAQK